MKTKILTTTLAFLTLLAISSSFFIASGAQNGNIVKVHLLPISNNISITEVKQSVRLSEVNQTKAINTYEYAGQSNGAITLSPGEIQNLTLDLKNTGNAAWEKETFHLGTSHPQDRDSAFTNNTWISANRIGINQDTVNPGSVAYFNFTITAPETSGVYYEYFRPVIDGTSWLSDVGIYWKITVEKPGENEATLPVFNKIGVKKIVVTISTQNLKCYEGTDIVCDYTISSGFPGLDTPTGNFKVEQKRDVAYSAAYNLYMNWWMAFTPNEAYGIHELPYWKYSWGIVTEGANHLGVKVSHGCVRLGIGPAKQVYDWAPIGTPVEIVN